MKLNNENMIWCLGLLINFSTNEIEVEEKITN